MIEADNMEDAVRQIDRKIARQALQEKGLGNNVKRIVGVGVKVVAYPIPLTTRLADVMPDSVLEIRRKVWRKQDILSS